MIQHTKTFFVPACHLRHIISYHTNLSNYTLLHPCMLHTSSYTSKYDNIYAPHWFCSKIYSIKSDNFPLGQIINKFIQQTTSSWIIFLLVGSETSQFKHKSKLGCFTSWSYQKQVDSKKHSSSYDRVHIGSDISPTKEYIISTICLWSWKLYWNFSSTLTHSDTLSHCLYISSRGCTSCLLLIDALFSIIPTLTNM